MKKAVEAPVTESETAPEWLEAATTLLGRDSDTGLVDTDRVLEAVNWLTRALFSHAKTDRAHRGKSGLLAQIQASQAVMNTVSAVQHVRVAQYAATAESLEPDPDSDDDTGSAADPAVREHAHELGQVCEFTDVDLAPVMCWGPMQATRRIDEAVDAVTKTPRLLDEMGAGRLDATRVAQVTWELAEAGDETCAQVEDVLLERGLPGWTSRQARNRARSLVRRCDPAAAKQTCTKRAKERIGVFTQPGPENGLTEWTAILRSKDALPASQAVDQLARQLHQDSTTGKTLGECRADALCDLILGNASVHTVVNVLVPVKTSSNGTSATNTPATSTTGTDSSAAHPGTPAGDDQPTSAAEAVLAGLLADYNWDAALQHLIIDLDQQTDPDTNTGSNPETGESPPDDDRCHPEPVPPDEPPPATQPSLISNPPPLCLPDIEIPGIGVISAEAVQDMIRTLGTTLTRALVDRHKGTVLATGTTTYRPTAAIRRHVLLRDQHCRFPGCDRPARFCDVDHVVPWPTGPTQVSNLQTLCRHHHRAKHETRWQVTMTEDGTCTWRYRPLAGETSPSGREYTTNPGSLEVTTNLHVTPRPAGHADQG